MDMRLDASDLFLEVPPFAELDSQVWEGNPPLAQQCDVSLPEKPSSKKKKKGKGLEVNGTSNTGSARRPDTRKKNGNLNVKRKAKEEEAVDVLAKKLRIPEQGSLITNPRMSVSGEARVDGDMGSDMASLGNAGRHKREREKPDRVWKADRVGEQLKTTAEIGGDVTYMRESKKADKVKKAQKVKAKGKGSEGGDGNAAGSMGANETGTPPDNVNMKSLQGIKKSKRGQAMGGLSQGSGMEDGEEKPLKKVKPSADHKGQSAGSSVSSDPKLKKALKAKTIEVPKGQGERMPHHSEAANADAVSGKGEVDHLEGGHLPKGEERNGYKRNKAKAGEDQDRERQCGIGEPAAMQTDGMRDKQGVAAKQRTKKGEKDRIETENRVEEKVKERTNRMAEKTGTIEDHGALDAKVGKHKAAENLFQANGAARAQEGATNDGGKEKKKGRPSLLDKMRARLQGGQFRMLNEKLYTCRSDDAFGFFGKDPGSFFQYHTGYKEQTSHWPRLPVDVIIEWLKGRSQKLTVADFGCGDAKLAASVRHKVHSLDLVAANPSVVACNMAKTALVSASVDVAVFCLSLMGTDYWRFLMEAYRVLKPNGWLIIAEVKSRFDPTNGGADPSHFLRALTKLGFEPQAQDDSNKMFLMFFLRKSKENLRRDKKSLQAIEWPTLKPCIYKRR